MISAIEGQLRAMKSFSVSARRFIFSSPSSRCSLICHSSNLIRSCKDRFGISGRSSSCGGSVIRFLNDSLNGVAAPGQGSPAFAPVHKAGTRRANNNSTQICLEKQADRRQTPCGWRERWLSRRKPPPGAPRWPTSRPRHPPRPVLPTGANGRAKTPKRARQAAVRPTATDKGE